jgi:hypothetical protein
MNPEEVLLLRRSTLMRSMVVIVDVDGMHLCCQRRELVLLGGERWHCKHTAGAAKLVPELQNLRRRYKGLTSELQNS